LKTPKPGQHLATKSGECRICKKDDSFGEAMACELRHRRVGEGTKLHPMNCTCAGDEVMGRHLSNSNGECVRYRCKQEVIYCCPRPACRCQGYTMTTCEATQCLASHKTNTDAVPAVRSEGAAQVRQNVLFGLASPSHRGGVHRGDEEDHNCTTCPWQHAERLWEWAHNLTLGHTRVGERGPHQQRRHKGRFRAIQATEFHL
jgi:hypothetical protein